MLLLFWGSVGLLFATWVAYPALMAAWGRLIPAPWRAGEGRPELSVIIPAHNEAGCIAEKVANTLAAAYPADRLEVIVVSDGSDDGTDAIVRDCADPRVRLLTQHPRRGKAQAMNLGVAAAHGELVAFTDADILIEPQALERLARWFVDPRVGAVSGRSSIRAAAGEPAGEGLKSWYDAVVRVGQSCSGRLIGADGALYMLRREWYQPLPPGTVADDLIAPLTVLCRRGRVIYDPEAIAQQRPAPSLRAEFERKVRIVSGVLTGLPHLLRVVRPWQWCIAGHFLCAKLLRYLSPVLVLCALIASAWLARAPLYLGLLACELVLLLWGVAAYLRVRGGQPAASWLGLPAYLLTMNLVPAVAVLALLRRRGEVAWGKGHR